MKVSVVMICKNEEKMIARALDSVHDKAYEIIVLDTGSTDATKEVSLRYPKVKLYEKAYENGAFSFSDARQEALKYATGDYIFQLDCDEVLVGTFPTTLPREAIYNFYIDNITDDGGKVESVCARFFPNIDGMKYIGTNAHEIIGSTKKDIPILGYTWGRITHDGYTSENRKDKNKSQRNIELLEKDYAIKSTPQVCFYLAQEYIIVEDNSKALSLLMEGWNNLSDNNALDQTFKPLIHHLIVTILINNDYRADIEKFEETIYNKSENPETSNALLQYYIKLDLVNKENHEGKILKYATDSLKHNNAAMLPAKSVEHNYKIAPYIVLGDYYNNKGDKLKALYFYELAHGSGLDDERILGICFNLIPKSPRNNPKWEYYTTKLYEKTKDPNLLKVLSECYLNSNNEEKELKGVEILSRLSSNDEKYNAIMTLLKNGKKNLADKMDLKVYNLDFKKVAGDVSVIIPTMFKADLDYFRYNLSNFEKNKYVNEVIVIANDTVPEGFFADYKKVKVIGDGNNIGVNPAWNLGIKNAKGKYYLLLNDDCLVRNDIIDSCMNIMEQSANIGLVCCDTHKQPLYDYASKEFARNNGIVFIDFDYRQLQNSNGWFIFGKKSEYKMIPSELNIFYGDDLLHYNTIHNGKRIVKIKSNYIAHDVSTTVNKLNIYNQGLLESEGEWFKNYFLSEYNNESMAGYVDNFLEMVRKSNKG